MREVFKGSEALAQGALTRGQLRWRYRRIHRDIYLPQSARPSLNDNIYAAWLWSGRNGVIAGRAAAAMHGARWVDDFAPVDLIGRFNHAPPGIVIRRERIAADEVVELNGLSVTTAARTALDLGRHLPTRMAVAHLDALARTTSLTVEDVAPLLKRYGGARGVRFCRMALSLMDAGAQSPRETWLRLLFIDNGLPRPTTQIHVVDTDGFEAYLDMGWEDVMVAAEYDGGQHLSDRAQYVGDIGRAERIEQLGWIDIKVVAEHRPQFILKRVRDAFERRKSAEIAAKAVILRRPRP